MSDYTGGEDGYSPLMGASHNFVDVNTLARHENPNYEGTPTQFFDDQGNLKAILADLVGSGQHPIDPYSFNPILKEGEKLTADTSRQATNEENQLLFLDNEGNQTTRNTGTPMVGGTLRDVMYEKDPGSRGGILPKDAYQAAALFAIMASAGTLGPALLAGEGAMGAAGGAGALGTIGGDIGAFTAADMAATAAGEGAFNMAGALGMTLDQAVNTGLISSTGELTAAGTETLMGLGGESTGAAGFSGAGAGAGGGMTDAEAEMLMKQDLLPADMQTPATADINAKDVLQNLNRARQLAGLANGAGGAGGLPAGGIPDLSGLGSGALPAAGATAGAGALSKISPQTLYTGNPTEKPFEIQKVEGFHPQAGQIDQKVLSDIISGGAKSNGSYGVAQSYPVSNPNPLPSLSLDSSGDIKGFAMGGGVDDNSWMYEHPTHVAEFKTGTTGHHVQGAGDGQSDDIPAMLADGEYVFDSDTVSALGNGSNKAGAGVLDKFREALREHKRSAPTDKIPPKAAPLTYLKQALKD
jgi:hypothetical protein